MVVEGRGDASVRVVTGSEQYRGTGHVPLVYDGPPDGDSVSAGFRRPPSWSAKAVIRDGEELPASGGSVDKRPLDLRSAPRRVVSMATHAAGEMVCQSCKRSYRTVGEYVEHGCEDGEVYVGWLAATEPPAEPSALSRSEFVEIVPARLLDDDEPEEEREEEPDGVEWSREEVEEFVESRESAGVVEVMGRFNLPPSARPVVEEFVG